MNKKRFYMGEFESSLDVQVSRGGIFITDCDLDDAVYIPHDRADDFLLGLKTMKEEYYLDMGK